MNRKILAVCLVAIMGVVGVYALTASLLWNVHYTAVVHQAGVEVFSDVGLTTPLTTYSGGTFNVGDTKTFTCYVLNPFNTNETVSMASSNWNPLSAPSYVGVAFTGNGTVLDALSSLAVNVSVTVYANASGTSLENFSMDLGFTGA